MSAFAAARSPLLAVALLLGGCTSGSEPGSAPSPTPTPEPSATPAGPVPEPPAGACYALTYAEALSPTSTARPVPCAREHTARTIEVGRLDAVVDGHLLAVDSQRVREQVAGRCPAVFADFVGGSPADRRLSMLRPVWFTPTVEASDQGARWYRCDLVALAADGRLAPLTGPLRGVLDGPGAERWGLCGTAQPGTPEFRRVICAADHSWRAVGVVPLEGGPEYPGEQAVRSAGEPPCEAVGRQQAADPLSFRWGYEWPTAEQWAAGQDYGLCWVPDEAG